MSQTALGLIRVTLDAFVSHGAYCTDSADPKKVPFLVRTFLITLVQACREKFPYSGQGGLRPLRSLAGPVRSSLRCGRPARRRRTTESPATRE